MKNKPGKRIISVFLSAVMLMSMLFVFTVSASAASGTKKWSINYQYYEGETLTTVSVSDAVVVTYKDLQNNYPNTDRECKTSTTKAGSVTITNNTDTLGTPYTATMSYTVTKGTAEKTSWDTGVDFDYSTQYQVDLFILKPGSSITFSIKKNSTIKFNSMYAFLTPLSTDEKALSILGADHGTLTIGGAADSDITLSSGEDNYSGSLPYGSEITLSAEPDEGYLFYGFCNGSSWYGGGSDNTLSFTLQEDTEYSVFFYLDSDPMFRIGAKRFVDLNLANAAAVASETDKTIVLERSGSISDATISEGVSLVIPSTDVTEGVWTEPVSTTAGFVTPTPFRTLTLEPGAELNVEGTLSVNGTLKLAQETQSGPTGTVGEIILPQGASINLNGSAVMYTWGYVYGGGDVYANDTSSVYEEMSINDLRGGRATLDMYELKDNGFGCFPFEQYYVQNIESRLHISSTATEYITAGLNISAIFVRSAPFIGSGGVFRLRAGSTLTKYYDAVNDKLIVEVDGDAILSNLQLSLSVGESQSEEIQSGTSFVIDSAEFILPINNMWIEQKSGCLTTHYRVNLLPDSGLIIDEGAEVLVAADSEVYIYDVDDLGSYNPKGKLVALSYSPTLGKKSPRTYQNMVDSFVEVNGTLDIQGTLNTTQNGANVTSRNPRVDQASYGKVIVHNNNVGHFWGAYQDSNRIAGFDEIPLVPTVLKNSNDTYRTTVARNNLEAEFYYVNLPNITDKDGNALSVWVSSEDPAYFNVKWVDKDGNTLQTKRVKNTELAVAEYTGEDILSYKDEDGGAVTKYYDFIGWESEYDIATQTLTYKPHFKEYDAIALIWKSGATEITRTYIRKLDKMTTADIPVEIINTWAIAHLATATSYSRYNGFTGQVKVANSGYLKDYTQSNIGSYRLAYDTTLNITWAEVTTAELYTVTWLNESSSAILTKKYFATQNPVFDGVEPVSSDSNKEFYGWQLGSTVYEKSATLPKPSADQTYTPVFNDKVKVTWANYDGAEIASAYYPKNSSASNAVYAGAAPVREPDAQYTYKFTGWDTHGVTKITSDVVFTAQYTTFLNTHTVTWTDEDGSELDRDTFYYGAMPSYAGGTPTKAETEDYTYTFRGWSPAVTPVSGDIVYRAAYTAVPKGAYAFVEKSLVLNGTIDVKFYFDMPALDGQKIRFTFLGETEVQDIEDKDTGEAHYSAKKRVCAPEMSDVITAELLTSDLSTVLATTQYSVADYISYYDHVSTPVEEKLIQLLQAMDNYGSYAHKYFRGTATAAHISGIPAYGSLTSTDITSAEDIKEQDYSAVGLKYYGTSLLLDSGTIMRHYFRITDQTLFDAAKDHVTFGGVQVQAKVYTFNEAAGYIYFDLEIPAAELDEAKTININGVQAHFSALDYVKRAIVKYEENPADEDNAKLAELVTALYWYNVYANTYFAD